ncbi:hypothetical protein CCYN2B_90074 [Capnocytophaga cynodegmi]|uniref:Uncharacterized protein n=1 Tax=Capnocytophaga cynodegmi TaxID=28189 RepID=A0A0B7HQR5_9FLAO|nr:hypothetical protein CCYN2B_90074 [Capnocytophaga cynodegmi]
MQENHRTRKELKKLEIEKSTIIKSLKIQKNGWMTIISMD